MMAVWDASRRRRRCPLEILILFVSAITATYDILIVDGFAVGPAVVPLSFRRAFISPTAAITTTQHTHPSPHRQHLLTSSATLDAARRRASRTMLFAAKSANLRPAASNLMEAGKQLAVAGEQLIQWSDLASLYGGGISAAGAQIRNAGDSVAQAAASCRFQTGQELVCDELRTAADCLLEASNKLGLGAEEADVDGQHDLQTILQACVPLVQQTSESLEKAGAGIMQNQPIPDIARCLKDAGQCLLKMSTTVGQLESVATRKAGKAGKATTSGDNDKNKEAGAVAGDAALRMLLAGEKMIEAARSLVPRVASPDAKAVGKRWIKGGGG